MTKAKTHDPAIEASSYSAPKMRRKKLLTLAQKPGFFASVKSFFRRIFGAE